MSRLAPEAEIHFERVAVNPDQIAEWDLPTRPTKSSDSRSRNFVGESVEVDAVPSTQLRGLVESVIERHVDAGILDRTNIAEAAELESLRALVATVPRAWGAS
ncbi:MAG: hypothetical protein H0T48_13810 [Gemmatimonadaceae bacterium]|nr:hypothetical protein [Gemmatimonadaceae bacterium]